MVNYKIQNSGRWQFDEHSKVSGHFLHEVVENTTGHVIKTDMTHGQAKTLCRHLNFGGGFDGFTPAFFLAKCENISYSDEELV